MDKNNDETLDLEPYFKLIRRFFKAIANWFNKNVFFIIIVFIAFIGYKATSFMLSEKQYKYVGVIDKEYIPNKNVELLLSSLVENVEILNTYNNNLNNDNFLAKLNKIEYKVLVEFKSDLNNKTQITEDTLEMKLNNPIKVSLISNYEIDSIGDHFVKYLNKHPFILKLRQEYLFNWNKKRTELTNKINTVDSIIKVTQSKNKIEKSDNIYINNVENEMTYKLVRYNNDLINELSSIEVLLEKSKNPDLFVIDGFNSPEKIKPHSFNSPLFYAKYFVFSVLIVLIISYFLKRMLGRK
ncbi:MAG: hypothetical protein WED10_00320 [Brumimicrobium sp.]